MTSLVTLRLRELIEDPNQGISNSFLEEVYQYILKLERDTREKDLHCDE